MKNLIIPLLLLSAYFGYSQTLDTPIKKYMQEITANELRAMLYFIASDQLEGRFPGSKGEKMAANYLATKYMEMNIPSAKPLAKGGANQPGDYYQKFNFKYQETLIESQNVVAVVEGSHPQLKKEAIIIMAHYDHKGIDTSLVGDQIMNGAADDGSGTVALLEIAESMQLAKKDGNGPLRTIIFLHNSAEEWGLWGSYNYIMNPVFPLDQTRMVINLDGVGGNDPKNPSGSPDYIYVISQDSTSKELIAWNKKINSELGFNINLVDPPIQWSSDQKNFEGLLIPSIYYSTGLTEHYHKPTDEPSTIDYDQMSKVVKLIFAMTWHMSNDLNLEFEFSKSDYAHNGKYVCRPCSCNSHVPLDEPGTCTECNMQLIPYWVKK